MMMLWLTSRKTENCASPIMIPRPRLTVIILITTEYQMEKNLFLAIRMVGEVYVEKGEYPKGLKYNEEYLRRSRNLQDSVLEQRALANLGWTYYTMAISDKKMFSQALRHFKRSLKAVGKICSTILSKKELSEMRGRALENIGKTYFVLEEKDLAEKLRDCCASCQALHLT